MGALCTNMEKNISENEQKSLRAVEEIKSRRGDVYMKEGKEECVKQQ